jgi:hypothetical protein
VLVVVVLGGEQEHAELGAVESSCVGWVDLRAADVLGWVRSDPAVDVGGAVEAGDTTGNRRSGSIAVAWFPKLSSAFVASPLGVAEVGTGQLARIVEREPKPPLTT